MGLFGKKQPENENISSTQNKSADNKTFNEEQSVARVEGAGGGTVERLSSNSAELQRLLNEFKAMQGEPVSHNHYANYANDTTGETEEYSDEHHSVEEGEKYTLSAEENSQIEKYLVGEENDAEEYVSDEDSEDADFVEISDNDEDDNSEFVEIGDNDDDVIYIDEREESEEVEEEYLDEDTEEIIEDEVIEDEEYVEDEDESLEEEYASDDIQDEVVEEYLDEDTEEIIEDEVIEDEEYVEEDIEDEEDIDEEILDEEVEEDEEIVEEETYEDDLYVDESSDNEQDYIEDDVVEDVEEFYDNEIEDEQEEYTEDNSEENVEDEQPIEDETISDGFNEDEIVEENYTSTVSEEDIDKKLDAKFSAFEEQLLSKIMATMNMANQTNNTISQSVPSIPLTVNENIEAEDLHFEGQVVIFEPLEKIKQATWEDVVRRKGHYTYHVTASSNGGWFIKRAKAPNPYAYLERKDEALKLAIVYAKREKAELKMHNEKGVIETSMSFGREKKIN